MRSQCCLRAFDQKTDELADYDHGLRRAPMIAAACRDKEFLSDVRSASPDPNFLHSWWLGQSGFVIAWRGHILILDPYLSDSLTKKYAGSALPHVRLIERVVDASRLHGISAVVVSHHHTDHLDGETLEPLFEGNPRAVLVAPLAHREMAARRAGIAAERIVGMDDGSHVEVGPFRIEGVPAAHEQIERDAEGRMRYLGYVISAGNFRLYHAGDTVPFDGMAARIGSVDLAFLPINGRDKGVAGNMNGIEAAALARALPAHTAVPCHFEMFKFNTAHPGEFLTACDQLGVRAVRLRAGERLSLLK